MKNRKLIVLFVLVALLSLSSCELIYNKTAKTGKVWFVGYGADFSGCGSKATLKYTISDIAEQGKAFAALAKKANVEFEAVYFIGDGTPDLPKDSAVYDCSWDTYKTNVKKTLQEAKDEDIIIFAFSGHGSGDYIKRSDLVYDGTSAFDDNCILFYSPNSSMFEFVTFATVYELIDSFKGTKLILCDTCFSGSFVTGDGVTVNEDVYGKAPITLLFDVNVKQSSSVWALTACTLTQESTEPEEYKHGGFTYYVLKALGWNEEKGEIETIKALDGNMISASSIANYVYKYGGYYKYHGNAQIPVFSAGSSDIVLFKF